MVKKHHDRDFTTIPNAVIKDQRLSMRDLGLLLWMLSKPPEWRFTKKSILSEIGQDGDRAIQASVKKLQAAGYLTIISGDREKGRITGSVWTVYDVPQLRNEATEQTSGLTRVCSSPQLRSPAVVNAVDNKEINNKQVSAAPATPCGAPLAGFYFDSDSGEWRRKEHK